MRELDRARELCLALPGTAEVAKAGGRPCFQVCGRSAYSMDDHHGDGRLALWVTSTHEAQAEAVAAEPARSFVPPYAGPQGWLGLRPDVDPTGTRWPPSWSRAGGCRRRAGWCGSATASP